MNEINSIVSSVIHSRGLEDAVRIFNENGLLEAYKHDDKGGLLKKISYKIGEYKAKGLLLNCSAYHDNTASKLVKLGNMIVASANGAVSGGLIVGAVYAVTVGEVQHRIAGKLKEKFAEGAYTKEESRIYDKTVKAVIKTIKEDRAMIKSLPEPERSSNNIELEMLNMQGAKTALYMLIGVASVGSTGIIASLLNPGAMLNAANAMFEAKMIADVAAISSTTIPGLVRYIKSDKKQKRQRF